MLPNQIHQVTRSVNLAGYALLFNDLIVANWKGQVPAWIHLRTQPRINVRIASRGLAEWIQYYRNTEAELSVSDPYTMDAVVHSIGLFLIHAARLDRERSTQRPKAPQDFLYNFQQLIEQHFRELKSPSQYADQLHITANYLNSLCKKRAGKSAGELIRQRILLESKRLLAHTDLSVSEVAFQLQFEDNSYFGRFFRKYTGMSPGAFRKNHHS
jgi:AraC-like DNA-binding protein